MLALAFGACAPNSQPAVVIDHARPMMTQQIHADAVTTTIDVPPASGVPQAAPVPRVEIQTLILEEPPAQTARLGPPVEPRRMPEMRPVPPPEPPATQAALPSPRFVVRPKPQLSTPQAQPRPKAAPARRKAAPVELPPRNSAGFMMPVIGRVVSEYGPRPNGLANDGINIAAPRGTPVRASDAGVVAYAGEEIRGFGRLLLLRHADGYVTAYAHNDKLLVKRGEMVARGQVIATVGASGGIDAPQLHFEIRQGSRPLDPRRLLAEDRDRPLPTNAARAFPPGLE